MKQNITGMEVFLFLSGSQLPGLYRELQVHREETRCHTSLPLSILSDGEFRRVACTIKVMVSSWGTNHCEFWRWPDSESSR